MRTIICGLSLSFLAACGVDETVFIPDYADQYCETMLGCVDPAALNFDGISTKDDCLAIIGPEVEDTVGRCDYSPKKAKRCLKAMEGMGCPGDGQTVEDVIPLECSEVSSNCSAPKETGTTGGTTPTGTTPTGGSGE